MRSTLCLETSIILFRRRRKGKGSRRGGGGDHNQEADSSWEGSQHSFVPLEDKNNFGELELDFSSSHVTTRLPDFGPTQSDNTEFRHNWRTSGSETIMYSSSFTYHLLLFMSHHLIFPLLSH